MLCKTFIPLVLILIPAVAQTPKRRVAVLNFEYGTVYNNVAAIFGSNTDVGKGIADLIVEKMVNGQTYSVVERKAIDKIIAEQNFSNSDRADANTAAKIGRLLGVDAIVMGSITVFGRDDKTTNVGGSAIGGRLSKYGIGGVGRTQSKAVVGLTARLVSTDTAEILAVANGNGESARAGTSLLGSGGSSGSAAGGAYDMTSRNFGSTIIGEATTAAVGNLVRALEQNAGKLPAESAAVVDGLVADVSGETLVLNVGTKAGVKPGMVLQVKRVGRAITDPATGRVIRRTEQLIGDVKITEADEISSVGSFTGSESPKVGDAVKSAAQQQ